MTSTADLITRTAQGDHDAWGLLAERHLGTLRTVAGAVCGGGEEAEDAVQEALLRLRAGAGGFRPRGPDPEADARRWIKRLAANAAIDQLRRRRRQRAQPLPEIAAPLTDPADPGLAAAVARALAHLTPPARAAVELRYRDGLEGAALAAALGISRVAARVRLHRALALLRRHLAAEGVVAAPALLAVLIPPAGAEEPVPQAAYAQPVPVPAVAAAGAALGLAATMVTALVLAGGGDASGSAAADAPSARVAATAAMGAADTGSIARAVSGQDPEPPAGGATTRAEPGTEPGQPSAMTETPDLAAGPTRALSARVSVRFTEDESLAQALARLARSVGTEIRCTIPESEAVPMMMAMDGDLRTVIDMVARLHGTTWRIQAGAIVIGPEDATPEPRP
jgi:RNA polymerase sigma-70 factor (ECF subfamily)